MMSALPPKADIADAMRNVRFVPKADEMRRSKKCMFSITASVMKSRPSTLQSENAIECRLGVIAWKSRQRRWPMLRRTRAGLLLKSNR